LSDKSAQANSEEPRHVRGFSFVDAARKSLKATRADALVLGVVLGVLFVAALLAMRHRGAFPFVDELNHYAQIALFRRGEFRVFTAYLTTIPGYHAIVAAVLWIFGADSLNAARLVNAAFALAGVTGFHALRRKLWPGTETLATAQLLVLPILVPLFFLVYTDMLALALLLWATFATVTARHWFSALLLAVLVSVRQNEVVWAGFLAILAAWPLWREHGSKAWRDIAARILPYCVPVVGFLGFWWWNGSISLSREQSALHPDLSLHAGNIFFALFLAGALMPLQAIAGLRDFADRAQRHAWLLAIPLLVFAAFWFGFEVDNPYNSVFPNLYIRNGVLLAIDGQPMLRAAAGIVAAVAACGFAFTRLRPAHAVWLYPFAALFLAASWLIEQRYALVPLVLWLAFREQRGRAIEWATLALWLALAVWLFQGMIAMRLFL
jgi:alpha-1,2-glucosyltransferase